MPCFAAEFISTIGPGNPVAHVQMYAPFLLICLAAASFTALVAGAITAPSENRIIINTPDCQAACEAAGHCSTGLTSCDQQPTCAIGCAIARAVDAGPSSQSDCNKECTAVTVRVVTPFICIHPLYCLQVRVHADMLHHDAASRCCVHLAAKGKGARDGWLSEVLQEFELSALCWVPAMEGEPDHSSRRSKPARVRHAVGRTLHRRVQLRARCTAKVSASCARSLFSRLCSSFFLAALNPLLVHTWPLLPNLC